MSFYIRQHLLLNDIIERASDDKGSTILIPDLQRPYVWKPNQVVFSNDQNKQEEWLSALFLNEAQVLPDVADLIELATKIKERETIVKDDLIKFVNGSATRVDTK
jgi:hypothetical protein